MTILSLFKLFIAKLEEIQLRELHPQRRKSLTKINSLLSFEAWFHSVVQAGLEFVLLLPQSPECWDRDVYHHIPLLKVWGMWKIIKMSLAGNRVIKRRRLEFVCL
jgi:hypothetical protein